MKDQLKNIVECLSCGEDIFIGRNRKPGAIITCDRCDNQFVIVELDPFMIDWSDYDENYNDDDEGSPEEFESFDVIESYDDGDDENDY